MTAVLSLVVPRTEPQSRIDDEPLFEIIDGQRVELSTMSILASRVTSNIQIQLGHHLLGNPVGEALMETLFRLPLPADAYIYESIINPAVFIVEGYNDVMPHDFATRMSQQELADVLAYLLTPDAR